MHRVINTNLYNIAVAYSSCIEHGVRSGIDKRIKLTEELSYLTTFKSF